MLELKWPKRLTIIRHGQSEQNAALDLFQDDLDGVLAEQKKIRDADIKLTDKGIWQAQESGKYLNTTAPFDICFVSPYRRTLQTAQEILKQLDYDLTVYNDFRLREKEFGRLHGFTTEEIKVKYPDEYEDRERDGKFYYRLPRGENYPDVSDRIYSFLSKLSRDYAGQNILIVTHQVPYILFKALFEHLNEAEIVALGSPPNCAIEQFELQTDERPEGRLVQTMFNYVAYAEEE
jgi:broad specificity phosphatase PhoE